MLMLRRVTTTMAQEIMYTSRDSQFFFKDLSLTALSQCPNVAVHMRRVRTDRLRDTMSRAPLAASDLQASQIQ
jgi:hypothetical protein